MDLDNRLLIKQVEARPALWNRDDKDYCHKKIISKLWAEIALIHGVHESKVKSKWKALRDTFRVELKKNPHQSPWNYFLDMQFLRGQIKTIPAANNKAEWEEDHDEIIFVKTEPEDGNSYYQEECRSEPDVDEQGCMSIDTPQKMADAVDDDYHFLMSLLPEMKRLQPEQKLLLRIKMMELFYKEIHQSSSRFSLTTTSQARIFTKLDYRGISSF